MRRNLIAAVAIAFAVSAAGSAGALTKVNAAIAADTTWCDGVNTGPIILEQPIFVNAGATLTILPGCIVRGQPRTAQAQSGVVAGTPGALIASQMGRIVAEGSATNPIVMTTATVDNNNDGIPDDGDGNNFRDPFPGFQDSPVGCIAAGTCALAETDANALFYDDTPTTAPLAMLDQSGAPNVSLWGGVVLLGKAPTNLGFANMAAGINYGEDTCEGLTFPGFTAIQAKYGGKEPHDNSGSLRYVSVRHGGDEIDNANEINGISLCGVGDGTILENVEVYANFDDGFEWFGGTVNGKNLMVTYTGDDAFDMDQGYTGVNQYLLGIQTFFNRQDTGGAYGSVSGDEAGEWDGDDAPANLRGDTSGNVPAAGDEFVCWPLSNPLISNMTILGASVEGGADWTSPNPAFAKTGNFGRIQMRNGYAGTLMNSIHVNTGGEAAFDIDGPTGACSDSQADDNVNNDLTRIATTTYRNVTAPGGGSLEQDTLDNGDDWADDLGCGDNHVNNAAFLGLVNADATFSPLGDPTGCPGSATCGKIVPSVKTGIGSVIDPRPDTGSSTATIGEGCIPQDTGLDRAGTYRGAFPASSPVLWTTGWTTLSIGGVLAD